MSSKWICMCLTVLSASSGLVAAAKAVPSSAVQQAFASLHSLTSKHGIHILTAFLALFIMRVFHRCYYLYLTSYRHKVMPWTFSPRKQLYAFFAKQGIPVSYHKVRSSLTTHLDLQYQRIGHGKKVFLLANGVGTDFFMWYGVLYHLLRLHEKLFSEEITLLVPTYRGLFVPTDELFATKEIPITIEHCMQDIRDILQDAKLPKGVEGMIGWSTGAQIALNFALASPHLVQSLFLLNPSTGETLHTALQPFFPLPKVFGRVISKVMVGSITYLKTLIPTNVWDFLRKVTFSYGFHYLFLTPLAFWNGFPPDQPVYFHEYMKDAFHNRTHTRGLLDLILSLDEASPKEVMTVSQPSVIVSGTPDFLTGVYYSNALSRSLPNNRHVNFRMGSHFILLEWPDLLAAELLDFLLHYPEQHRLDQQLDTSQGKKKHQ